MAKPIAYRDSARSKVWIVAPSPPPHGGMSVQAKSAVKKLQNSGIAAEMIPTNPPLPRLFGMFERIPGLRTVLREMKYLKSLLPIVCQHGVVHHFSASYLYFFLHSAPLLILSRRIPARIILNYRGGKAGDFLKTWSWATIPLMRRADEIVVPSEFLQRVFKEYGLSATLVPNLADTTLFPFRKRQRFYPRLFVTRNLEAIYGIETVLRAFRIVQARVPSASLGIAGGGSELQRLCRLVVDWDLRNVVFFGAIPNKRLPGLYKRHDIYVNASQVDNFPGALVEAACSGLPIVTTRAGGIPDMIRNRENGLLCEVGDAAALANGVLELLDNQKLASELATAAHIWAQQFSWSEIFPQLMKCYGFGIEHRQPSLESQEMPAH